METVPTVECDICSLNIERDHFMCHFICRHPDVLYTLYATAQPQQLTIINDDITLINFDFSESEDEPLPHEVCINDISVQNIKPEDICPICLDNLEEKDFVCKMNACNHNYCKNCIERWVMFNKECPMCKRDLW